jgi:peptidyl-dipeptidase Dcp
MYILLTSWHIKIYNHMRQFFLFSIITLTITFLSCKNKEMTAEKSSSDNPLLAEFTTPYGVPPFDLIKDEHYKPALEGAMELHKAEIDAIAENEAEADFANTIEAMDKTGSTLSRVSSIFYNMSNAHTNDNIEQVSTEIAPLMSKHSDYISLNEKLFARVKKIWESKESLGLNEEQNKLLEKTYKSFIRNGALLTAAEKESITKINEELSVLTVKFGQNTLSEVNEFQMLVENADELKGLSEGLIAAQQMLQKLPEKKEMVVFITKSKRDAFPAIC